MAFAVKADLPDPGARTFVLPAQKTMYGGKLIAAGDVAFVFASETSGGRGLAARAVVTFAEPSPRRDGVARQTPLVSVRLERAALAQRPLGRAELKGFRDWDDGRPETELNFKLYRQATDKIVGLSESTAAFLERFFRPPSGLAA